MKTLRYKQFLLVIAGLLLIVFIIKAIFFFTAKPIISVDYVAQLNQQSRPENCNPNENAALYYQKAFNAFIEMPYELHHLRQQTDFNDQDRVLLENWLASNATAFKYFREAADKPYYWLERISLGIPPTIGGIMIPELNSHRALVDALIWNARIDETQGQYQTALKNLLTCYRSGEHKCNPKYLVIDQLFGLRIKSTVLEDAFRIIDKHTIENRDLEFFQGRLKEQLDSSTYVPSMQTEILFAYDALQQVYVDNGKGTGRWAWSVGWHVPPYIIGESKFHREYKTLKERLYYCLVGPDRSEIAEKIEELSTLYDQMMNKTPWQIKNSGINYSRKIKNITNNNLFFDMLPLNPEGLLHAYYKTTAQTDALITVLALLRIKNDTGLFPESLDKLLEAGYLHSLPKDIYSGGSLIYKLTAEGFTLYSVGEDFVDNDGVVQIINSTSTVPLPMGTGVPDTISHIESPDIVYWPVHCIE